MSLTLGLTGMDPATEAALKAAFVEANARLGGRWALVPDAEASHVVVDMDSMYGPMSWLRLHAAGRQVIGLTSAPRTQTDYRLGRPFDVAQLLALLADVARGAGIELQAGRDAAPADATATTAATTAPETQAPAPAAATATPEPAPIAAAQPQEASAPPAPAPPPASALAAAEAPVPVTAAPAAPPPPPAATATVRTLAAWLQPGALNGRVRYRAGDGTSVLIDAAAEAWHGPVALKTVAACFQGSVAQADLETLDADAWSREAAAAGPAQPLSRLRWLGGLLAGGGKLLPDQDPEGRFQLNKWPQTEREYPRHFRIATQMMKGPATLAEIAEASGVPAADVADFINANLATGFAEPAVETPAVAEEPAKARGGLLGRLRSR